MLTGHKSKNLIKCEIAYVLIGDTTDGVWHTKMMWRREGDPASVDFDWERVLKREEKKGDVVGFLHTHPDGCTNPSARDDRTMLAWSTCFGKPLLCLIEESDEIRGWIYNYKDETRTKVEKVIRFRNNWLVTIQ